MKSIEEGIEMLSRAILSEASEQTTQQVSDAQAKAEQIRKQGQAQAEEIRKAILDRARQDAEQLRGQAVANAQLRARSEQYQRREALFDHVFNQTRERLGNLAEAADYGQIARRLVKEAVERIGTPQVLLHLDEKTSRVLDGDALRGIGQECGVEIKVAEPLAKGTGVVAESDNGRLQFDNTLERRLQLLQNSLRSPVFNLLSGEKP